MCILDLISFLIYILFYIYIYIIYFLFLLMLFCILIINAVRIKKYVLLSCKFNCSVQF